MLLVEVCMIYLCSCMYIYTCINRVNYCIFWVFWLYNVCSYMFCVYPCLFTYCIIYKLGIVYIFILVYLYTAYCCIICTALCFVFIDVYFVCSAVGCLGFYGY